MRARATHALPARLEGVRRRFERWRRTRKTRSRIPDPLWASAVKAASKYGVHRTAKVLRVDYYSLKERVEAATHEKSDRDAVAALGKSGWGAAADGGSRGRAVLPRGKAATGRGGVAADRGGIAAGRGEPAASGGRAGAGRGEKGTTAAATFVELASPVSGELRECILELEDPGGAKMRVHLKGSEAPDLAALTRSFRDTTCPLHTDRGEA